MLALCTDLFFCMTAIVCFLFKPSVAGGWVGMPTTGPLLSALQNKKPETA